MFSSLIFTLGWKVTPSSNQFLHEYGRQNFDLESRNLIVSESSRAIVKMMRKSIGIYFVQRDLYINNIGSSILWYMVILHSLGMFTSRSNGYINPTLLLYLETLLLISTFCKLVKYSTSNINSIKTFFPKPPEYSILPFYSELEGVSVACALVCGEYRTSK